MLLLLLNEGKTFDISRAYFVCMKIISTLFCYTVSHDPCQLCHSSHVMPSKCSYINITLKHAHTRIVSNLPNNFIHTNCEYTLTNFAPCYRWIREIEQLKWHKVFAFKQVHERKLLQLKMAGSKIFDGILSLKNVHTVQTSSWILRQI